MRIQRNHRYAFLYDYLQVEGGAEKVALEMQRNFTDLKVITSQINSDRFPSSDTRIEEVGSYGRFYGLAALRILSAVYRFYFKARDLRSYETVLYSGIYAPLAVRHHRLGKNIYYCHTPPRFLYDLREKYEKKLSPLGRSLFGIFCRVFERYYVEAIEEMDLLIANSANVQGRIDRYLGLDAEIIYPPVNHEGYGWCASEGYYLSTARLEPFKRVDRIIEAFKEMPEKKLVVASGGSDLGRLQDLAAGAANIDFTGWCSRGQLVSLVNSTIATIYIPVDEDFGMSPVESMAAGKPVIGVDEGGVSETVVDGETGILVSGLATKDELIEAVNLLSAERALRMRPACEERAKEFSTEVFLSKIRDVMCGLG